MEMWFSDNIGRDSLGLGHLLGREDDSTPLSGVEEPPQMGLLLSSPLASCACGGVSGLTSSSTWTLPVHQLSKTLCDHRAIFFVDDKFPQQRRDFTIEVFSVTKIVYRREVGVTSTQTAYH